MTDDAGAVVAMRVRISGRVQAVWYRGWTIDEAGARGLRGWVRNRRDGAVEALFIGPHEQVSEMIQRCHRGPPAASVANVVAAPAEDDGSLGFRQLPTE